MEIGVVLLDLVILFFVQLTDPAAAELLFVDTYEHWNVYVRLAQTNVFFGEAADDAALRTKRNRPVD